MLIFGHVGITTLLIKRCEKVIMGKNIKNNNFIDYRIVIVGALLPDIIDKSVVQFIYGLRNHSGHFIAHSFVFSGLLIVDGIILIFINKNNNVSLLGLCSLIHQFLDKLILLPNIFLLPRIPLSKIKPVENTIMTISSDFPYLKDVVLYLEQPYVFLSEVIGFAILVYLALKLFNLHMKIAKVNGIKE